MSYNNEFLGIVCDGDLLHYVWLQALEKYMVEQKGLEEVRKIVSLAKYVELAQRINHIEEKIAEKQLRTRSDLQYRYPLCIIMDLKSSNYSAFELNKSLNKCQLIFPFIETYNHSYFERSW